MVICLKFNFINTGGHWPVSEYYAFMAVLPCVC